MPLQKVTIEDELIHDIDQMIKALKLRRAAILARMPAVSVQYRGRNSGFTDEDGQPWTKESFVNGKGRGKADA